MDGKGVGVGDPSRDGKKTTCQDSGTRWGFWSLCRTNNHKRWILVQ